MDREGFDHRVESGSGHCAVRELFANRSLSRAHRAWRVEDHVEVVPLHGAVPGTGEPVGEGAKEDSAEMDERLSQVERPTNPSEAMGRKHRIVNLQDSAAMSGARPGRSRQPPLAAAIGSDGPIIVGKPPISAGQTGATVPALKQSVPSDA